MQPVFTQVPPNALRSTIATFMPAADNRAANGGPACPVPMMIASNFCMALPRRFRLSRSGASFDRFYIEAHRLVEDHPFERIEFALPGRALDCGARVGEPGLPTHPDPRCAEIDVLRVILVFEPRRKQSDHVHLRQASIAGELAHLRRAARIRGDVFQEL